MQLIQCVSAYLALIALSDKEYDYRTAHALTVLKRKLKPHVEFYTAEERKLVSEYAQKDDAGKAVFTPHGTFVFKDGAKPEEYAERRAELGAVEVGEEFAPVCASAPSAISPAHLEALEGFVCFSAEGGGDK